MNKNLRELALRVAKDNARRSRGLWNQIFERLPPSPPPWEDWKYSIFDIQQDSEDCIDLVLVKEFLQHEDSGDMELWRFTIEKRLFRRSKLKLSIDSGPSKATFIETKGRSDLGSVD